jgi:hypothetical protein
MLSIIDRTRLGKVVYGAIGKLGLADPSDVQKMRR